MKIIVTLLVMIEKHNKFSKEKNNNNNGGNTNEISYKRNKNKTTVGLSVLSLTNK